MVEVKPMVNNGNSNWVNEVDIWKHTNGHKSNSIAVIYPLKYRNIKSDKGWDVKHVTNKPDISIKNWQLLQVYVDPQSLKRYSINSLEMAEVQDDPIVDLKWIMILGEELPKKEEPE